MEYVPFGRTGIRVSTLCMGTMTFGKEADEKTSFALMDRALEAGINFFDTANVYNMRDKGLSEEIIGRWLGSRRREDIVLASKCHAPMGADPNARGSSRRHIVLAVEQSLKRLKTDWLDILYLHGWDDDTALEETFAAIDTLVQQGKVFYAGVSNFAAWQTMKALAVCAAGNLAPVACVQPMYNLVKRQAEVEILPLALSENLAVCPYNPLAAGLLTGKYGRGETGRIRENDMYAKRYEDKGYWDVSERFVQYARSIGKSPAALAIAWVSGHPAVTSTILGARNLEQMDDTLGCLRLELAPEQRAKITALSIDPPLPTDR